MSNASGGHVTDRLYWDDPYLREFEATVVDRLLVAGSHAVVLDRTAFYPIGGGQPSDLGELNGVVVTEVQAGGQGAVQHFLADDLPGDRVLGRIDWDRRFDHMQQHTGQHILSQACIQSIGAETVGFHLGQDICTIDLDQVDVSMDGLAEAESLANRVVAENRLVTSIIVSREDANSTVPLRRGPAMEGDVRVVQVQGFDSTACGGTHVRSTAEVALIKMVARERHHGGRTRVAFLCGGRALADYGRKHLLIRDLGAHLTTGEGDILGAVQRLSHDVKVARRAQQAIEEAFLASEARRLYLEAADAEGIRLVQEIFDGDVWSADAVKGLATRLAAQSQCVALLGWSGDKVQLTFACSPEVPVDMGALMRAACDHIGGRGGGRADWAQGGAAADEPVGEALDRVARLLWVQIVGIQNASKVRG